MLLCYSLFNRESSRLGRCPERRSIKALHNRVAYRERARFLDFDFVLDYVAALAEPIYIKGVAGVAGSDVEAYVVVPVVDHAGVGAEGFYGGGAHIGQLDVLQVAVGFYVELYLKQVSYVEDGSGFDFLKEVATGGVVDAPDGAFEGYAVALGLDFVKGLGEGAVDCSPAYSFGLGVNYYIGLVAAYGTCPGLGGQAGHCL